MKFGGTSVADAAAVERLISIVRGKLPFSPVVVVSALSKVTDSLYRIADYAKEKDYSSADEIIEKLTERHVGMCRELFGSDEHLLSKATEHIKLIMENLRELVRAVIVLGELSDRCKAGIISNGEILSSYIISFALNHNGLRTSLMDARDMIVTDETYLKGEPDIKEITARAPQVVKRAFDGADVVITQGFISSTIDGVTTVLGRGGSDYTASLIGMAINASEVEIWTDVDGVLTADPRKVKSSRRLVTISFEEAAELAHFGAKVLHPLTIQPAVEKNIPVRVLNSKSPECPGTLILPDFRIASGAKSVSYKENITVVNIFSTRMINTYGFLNKLFEVFEKHHIPVDLISTSEANVSLTLDDQTYLNDKVLNELSAFSRVNVENDKSQVSIIGKDLKNTRGICNKVFSSLSDYKISMISQGASAINISFVVEREDLDNVIVALHKEFFEGEEYIMMQSA